MRTCIADIETFWSADHTLSKMNPIEYCLSPITELQSMAICFDDGPIDFIFGPAAIQYYVDNIDWSDVLLVGHNMSQFDSMLFAWRLGVKPALWACTLSMAKPIYQKVSSLSLSSLCSMLSLGKKGSLDSVGTKGRKCEDFTKEEIRLMGVYNRIDVELTRELFNFLRPRTFDQEMEVIDFTIRMLVEPSLRVHKKLLEDALAVEKKRKFTAINQLQKELGIESAEEMRKQLMSNPKLGKLLEEQGCELPKKTSTRTNKDTLAFAATDRGFQALRGHDNKTIRDIVDTRLEVKSSLLETRMQSFLNIASVRPEGDMPIALNYWGATTGRFSGAMKINQQNLPRVCGIPSDVLRKSLVAPSGHKIVVADLSGVELRVNHFLWGVPSSMQLFRDDAQADLYTHFASLRWNVPKEEVTKQQRQFAKAMQLGLGFGMGAAKFQYVTQQQGIDLTEDTAKNEVLAWRGFYKEIEKGWGRCQEAILAMFTGQSYVISPTVPFIRTSKNEIWTHEAKLRYPYLRAVDGAEREFEYGLKKFTSKIYGGMLCENLVQHLARQILIEHLLIIQKRYRIAHIVHDEVVLVVPKNEVEEALDFVLTTMRTAPSWWPDIVLWAEGGFGDSYGEVKS